MTEQFGTGMYDRKYENKEESKPRSVVTYFVDNYLGQAENCLDLGSGAGRHSKYIAEKGIRVTAIDLSEKGVEKTREILKEFQGSQALVGNIHNLPFGNESFDSLVCNRVLDYNDDSGLEIAFAEIERVVKGNGLILITVRSISQLPKDDEILLTENSNGGKSFKVGNSLEIQHYFTEQEIKSLADIHNFEIVDIREEKKTNDKSEWQTIMRKK